MKTILLIASSVFVFSTFSQVKIGDNHDNINANSLLELESTDKGLLFPRVALTATDNVAPLAAHVQGMTVYNTATAGSGGTAVTPGLYINNGTSWVAIDGADGKTILNGTVDPTTEGTDGDFYINTATNYIFGPKASGSWPAGTSLVGVDANPIGTVITKMSDNTPTGYLYCNGQSVSTTTYAALFADIGYTYGGSGGTFNVPDLRGQFLRGQNDGAGVDPDAASRTGGDVVGSSQGGATKRPTTSFTTNSTGSHHHNLPHSVVNDANLNTGYGGTWDSGLGTGWVAQNISGFSRSTPYTDDKGSHSHSVTGGGDNETRPMNIAVRYYIKF